MHQNIDHMNEDMKRLHKLMHQNIDHMNKDMKRLHMLAVRKLDKQLKIDDQCLCFE
jgi:hypothetical protein